MNTPPVKQPTEDSKQKTDKTSVPLPKEIGGADQPEPTRYGDWQFKGRVSDF